MDHVLKVDSFFDDFQRLPAHFPEPLVVGDGVLYCCCESTHVSCFDDVPVDPFNDKIAFGSVGLRTDHRKSRRHGLVERQPPQARQSE